MQQDFDLSAHKKRLKRGIIHIEVIDTDLADTFVVGINVGQQRLDIGQLAFDGQCERRHRAFHALQYVHAEKVNEAFFPVDLAEEALSAPDLGAVLFIIGRLLVRQDITERRV